jgi:hypothetical protein
VAFGLERFDQAHGLAALGAAQSPILGYWMGLLRDCWFSSVGVPEQPPDVVKQMAITVAKEILFFLRFTPANASSEEALCTKFYMRCT